MKKRQKIFWTLYWTLICSLEFSIMLMHYNDTNTNFYFWICVSLTGLSLINIWSNDKYLKMIQSKEE